jgi:hypothetical protein
MGISLDQYRQMLARKPGWANSNPTPDVIKAEKVLQLQIIDECGRLGWIVFYGSMAHRTFRVRGEPDLIVLADRTRLFLIECKSAKGKRSPHQQGIANWAEKLGHVVHVVRTMDEFNTLTKGWTDTGG